MILNSGCAKSNIDNTETNLSYLDSLAILPIIFDSINKEALLYEESQVRISNSCFDPISIKSVLRISGNCAGQIMIGRDVNNVDVVQAILDFYDKEKIELDPYSTAYFMRFNDAYLNTQMNDVDSRIKQLRESKDSIFVELNDFYNEEHYELQRYKLYKDYLNLKELIIPFSYSHVQINTPKNCNMLDSILVKALEAFYIMRDNESKMHFNLSYAYLFKKAKFDEDSTAKKNLEIIDCLIPVQLKRKEVMYMEPPPLPF